MSGKDRETRRQQEDEMLASIQNLREISRCCSSGEQLKPELAHWLGAKLHEFLDQRSTSLEEALGLRYPRGGLSWWQEEAIVKRDSALRELAETCFSGMSRSAKANEIHTLSTRYGASAWRIDQDRHEMPDHYRGKPKEFLWRAFKSGAAMPLTPRHLRTILA